MASVEKWLVIIDKINAENDKPLPAEEMLARLGDELSEVMITKQAGNKPRTTLFGKPPIPQEDIKSKWYYQLKGHPAITKEQLRDYFFTKRSEEVVIHPVYRAIYDFYNKFVSNPGASNLKMIKEYFENIKITAQEGNDTNGKLICDAFLAILRKYEGKQLSGKTLTDFKNEVRKFLEENVEKNIASISKKSRESIVVHVQDVSVKSVLKADEDESNLLKAFDMRYPEFLNEPESIRRIEVNPIYEELQALIVDPSVPKYSDLQKKYANRLNKFIQEIDAGQDETQELQDERAVCIKMIEICGRYSEQKSENVVQEGLDFKKEIKNLRDTVHPYVFRELKPVEDLPTLRLLVGIEEKPEEVKKEGVAQAGRKVK